MTVYLVEYSFGIECEMSNKEMAKKIDVHPRYIPQKLKEVMKLLRRLGNAIQGTPEDIQRAIESPCYMMTAVGEQASLFTRETKTPGKIRKPKSKKQDKPEMDGRGSVEQLTLFDLE